MFKAAATVRLDKNESADKKITNEAASTSNFLSVIYFYVSAFLLLAMDNTISPPFPTLRSSRLTIRRKNEHVWNEL